MPKLGIRAKVVEGEDGGVQIHFEGPRASRIDAKLLQGCVNEVLACADDNACLDRGLNLKGACVDRFARHGSRTECFEKAFGLVKRAR
jgi:hypothetical protein